MREHNIMSNDIKEKLKLLTTKERKYFKMMFPTSGVLYITAKPGVAKSAIMKSIAEKMDYAYIDRRLSMIDETDIGLFPDKIEIDGEKYLDFVTPRWAHEANKRPTIIHFEELNRSTQQVRNAALQLLLEREIGAEFKFNSSVLMCASGNLGTEDNTDVEEFDNALNNRLIHVKHDLSYTEWIEAFANKNIHPIIVKFISENPEYLYKDPTMDKNSNNEEIVNPAYATPRSWTFLSDFIISNYGLDCDVKEFLGDLLEIGPSYIGATALVFGKYCRDLVTLNIKDILDRFDDVEAELDKCQRAKYSELIQSLKKISIEKMTDKQRENAHKFLKKIGDDEMMDYMIGIVDLVEKNNNIPNTIKFLSKYPDIGMKMFAYNKSQVGKSKVVINKK